MVKINLQGRCKNIRPTRFDSEPACCAIVVELDHSFSLPDSLYDVQLFIPAEFATLLEVDSPITFTLEQHE
jgi:hypothetical protein